jgi:predicted nucleic acid-binding Zn ribbon protein
MPGLDLWCAGCGQQMMRRKGSLPLGQAMCRLCRRLQRESERLCPVCGNPFRPRRVAEVPQTCSPTCGQVLRWSRPRTEPKVPRVRAAKSAGKTAARGYGAKHQALRKEWAAKVDAGLVDCPRCGRPILPGTPWDLGHDDDDRTIYRGPEHQRCNRATNRRGRPRNRYTRRTPRIPAPTIRQPPTAARW